MQTSFSLFDPEITVLVRNSARKLCRSPGFSRDEFEDIQQELLLHLWERRHLYDPTKASPAGFACMLIKRKVISMVRHRNAEKRSPRREQCSLNESVRDCDGRSVARHQLPSPAICGYSVGIGCCVATAAAWTIWIVCSMVNQSISRTRTRLTTCA